MYLHLKLEIITFRDDCESQFQCNGKMDKTNTREKGRKRDGTRERSNRSRSRRRKYCFVSSFRVLVIRDLVRPGPTIIVASLGVIALAREIGLTISGTLAGGKEPQLTETGRALMNRNY